jgi:hypothetical protein
MKVNNVGGKVGVGFLIHIKRRVRDSVWGSTSVGVRWFVMGANNSFVHRSTRFISMISNGALF